MRRVWKFGALAGATAVAAFGSSWLVSGVLAQPLLVGLAASAVALCSLCLAAILWAHRSIRRALERAREEADLKMSGMLFDILSFNGLPRCAAEYPWTTFSASPLFLRHLDRLLESHRPRAIVECGSGATTLVISHAIAKNRDHPCRFISLEHDEQWWNTVRSYLDEHDLLEYVELVRAPLVPHRLNGSSHLWYSLEPWMATISAVDLLVVDGPPEHVQEHARYPALPVLRSAMAPGAKILLDDLCRTSEQAVLRRWASEYDAQFQVFNSTHRHALLTLPKDGAANAGPG